MTQGDLDRKRIFDKYAGNLHLLYNEGLLPHLELTADPTYICPLCLGHFYQDDLDTSKPNHLTLEDVPPKSLGGKAKILTCRACNNTAGQAIDHHLRSRMVAMDNQQFLPGSSFPAKLVQDGKTTQGQITVERDRTIRVRQAYKHNRRETLDNFVEGISPSKGNPLMDIQFYPTRADFKRMEVALLKIAYLMCFEKYGYVFITDPRYDVIRAQIKSPNADIYPTKAWFVGPFKENNVGCHFVTDQGMECIMAIFSLRTLTTRIFGFIIPVKENPIIEVVAAFHARIALNTGNYANFYQFNHQDQYLSSLDNINAVRAFMENLEAQ